MKKLIDYRNALIDSLTNEETQRLTDQKASYADTFKEEQCAIMVTRDLDFGLGRVHGAKIEHTGIKTNVFRNIQDSLAWLKVELDEEEINLG